MNPRLRKRHSRVRQMRQPQPSAKSSGVVLIAFGAEQLGGVPALRRGVVAVRGRWLAVRINRIGGRG